ncbi:hypothetical protein SteCoe_27846 [Stentor coeruleus]|uniref:FYVE-type domain-containing protein n=1 Tax=Stentor coeruleus TaxID=5963 RepID=A0A1R2B9I4_9CILI|nr:hypothetical protein SteCoe_27846 [Stentor coeruleus]
MDETGVKTKVQRKNSELFNNTKLGKQICHICSEKGKMQSCIVCNKASCSMHSMIVGIQNPNRICDECFREETLKSMSSINNLHEQLSNEISTLADKRNSNTQTLNKSSGKIRNLQKELQDKEAYYQKKIEDLKAKIESTKAKTSSDLKALPEIQKETLNIEMQTEMTKKKLSEVNVNLITAKAEVEIMVKERTSLFAELNEVTDFVRSQVPVKLLKQIICNPCYQQVRHAFVQMFRLIVPIKDEVKAANIKSAPNRKGVCTNCTTF